MTDDEKLLRFSDWDGVTLQSQLGISFTVISCLCHE